MSARCPKRTKRPRVRAGSFATIGAASRILRMRFPAEVQMLHDELKYGRRHNRWSARRTESVLLREIKALRPRTATPREVRPVRRPRSRHSVRRRTRSSRGSPDGSDLAPQAWPLPSFRRTR